MAHSPAAADHATMKTATAAKKTKKGKTLKLEFRASLVKEPLGMLQLLPGDDSSPKAATKDDAFLAVDDASAESADRRDALRLVGDDLARLLAMDYDTFWAHLVHDLSVRRALDSVLCHAYRPDEGGDAQQPLEPDRAATASRVRRLAFRVFYRLSQPERADAAAFGDLLYDHWVFDAVKMIDLCALYGASNRDAVEAVLTNVTRCQPKYLEDLQEAVALLVQTLAEVSARLGAAAAAPRDEDTQVCLSVAHALLSLARAFPAGLAACAKADAGVLAQAVETYDAALPLLPAGRTARTRALLLDLVDVLLDAAADQEGLVEAVDAALTRVHALADRADGGRVRPGRCLRHYDAVHGLVARLERARVPSLPPPEKVRLDAVLSSLRKAIHGTLGHGGGGKKAAAARPAAVTKPSRSAEAREKAAGLLAVLGEGSMSADFCDDALAAFGGSVERTLNAILEGQLPSHLQRVDNRAAYVSPSLAPSGHAPLPEAKHNEAEEDEDKVAEELAEYMARTGRRAKADREAAKPKANEFSSEAEREALRAFVVSYEEGYDDEYDDTYDEFTSFQVDESEVDMDMRQGQQQQQQQQEQRQGSPPAVGQQQLSEERKDGGGQGRGRGKNRGGKGGGGGGGQGGGRKVDLSQRTKESLRARANKERNKGKHKKRAAQKKGAL